MIHALSACRHGATLHMPERLSATRFAGWLETHGIEWTNIPELVARQPASPHDPGIVLKQFQFGGGTWNPSSIVNMWARFPICGNGFYGLTETGYATLLPNDTNEMTKLASAGLRAPFRELKLVDEHGLEVPVGQTGELLVRGRGMFQGYRNRPDANTELFDGDWFKSGDYLRRDGFGFHYFMGRKKDMIRRSNENIAAREVEAMICELPEVGTAAAVAVKDADRGEVVKIWVELKEGVDPRDVSAERILDHARLRLAAFKVPRYVKFIAALTRVASNASKVSKQELLDDKNPLAGTFNGTSGRWLAGSG